MKTDNLINYKVPQDVMCDVLRILHNNHIRYKVKSVHPQDNIATFEVDATSVKRKEPLQNIEEIITDYREFFKDVVGDAILSLYNEPEEDENQY